MMDMLEMPGCEIRGNDMRVDGAITKTNGGMPWVWQNYISTCYGAPPGSCGKPVVSHDHAPYCVSCYHAYLSESRQVVLADKRATIIETGVGEGWLPPEVVRWKEVSLYPWQATGLTQLEASPDRSAWISGDPGTGKTELAKQVLLRTVYWGKEVAFFSAYDLLRIGRNVNALKAAERAALLVIDDMSKAQFNEWNPGILHDVLSKRASRKLRTLVTSEKSGKEIGALLHSVTGGTFSKSTLDRLSWAGATCLSITLAGANLRRETPQQGEMI